MGSWIPMSVLVEKKKYIQLHLPSISSPFFSCPHCTGFLFPIVCFQKSPPITPVLRINAGRHPPVTCSFISSWFQDFHRHFRCHWFCGAVDDYSEMWNSKMVEKLKNQRRHWLQQIEPKAAKNCRMIVDSLRKNWLSWSVKAVSHWHFCVTLIWAIKKYYEPARDRLKVIDLDWCKTARQSGFSLILFFWGGPRGSLAIFIIWDSMSLCRLYRLPRHQCDGRFSVAIGLHNEKLLSYCIYVCR